MKKQILMLSLAAALVAPASVVAHEGETEPTYPPDDGCQPSQVITNTITSPANGATVGRTFALTGTIKPTNGYQQYVAIEIDGQGYVYPQNRVLDPNNYSVQYAYAQTDLNGNFSVTIDLEGGQVTEQYVSGSNNANGRVIRSAVPAGNHKISLGYGGHCSNGAAEIAVTVKDDAPKAVSRVTPQFTQAPKPTPSPTASSITPTPEAVAGESGSIPTVWLVVFGALGGVALLLGGQQAWRLYQARKAGSDTIAKSK